MATFGRHAVAIIVHIRVWTRAASQEGADFALSVLEIRCVYVYIYIYMYTCIHTYIHTYIA